MLLVVTLLAFQSADILHGHAIHLTVLDIVMEFLVNAIEFVAGSAVAVELHFRLAVTVDTPAHA